MVLVYQVQHDFVTVAVSIWAISHFPFRIFVLLLDDVIISISRMASNLVPRVISYGFKNYSESVDKRTADCRFCKTKVTEVTRTTSNFVRHLKTHHEE